MTTTCLVVGAGPGIGASFGQLMAAEGHAVALASRSGAAALPATGRATPRYRCEVADPGSVEALFGQLDAELPPLDVVLFNAAHRSRGPIAELAADEVRRSLETTAFGGFLVAQQAARRMLARGSGTILFTGASASVKGYALSAPFAMGKFALRGLAQSMARELAPLGVHVAHVVIDGAVRQPDRPPAPDAPPDSQLDPEAIAQAMLGLVRQPRSAWSWEIELRPWVERF